MYSELTPNKPKSSYARKFINFVFNSGLIHAAHIFSSKSLTVLNYHRINNPEHENFDSFKPNISARIEDFTQQMEYLARWFNVISMRHLANWLDGHQNLPPNAALITFDDGYLDNYTNAYPILLRYNFPATIFLTTNHIDTDMSFYWDTAAYCFLHTDRTEVEFPDGSYQSWKNPTQRDQVCKSWIEALKPLQDIEKQRFASQLSGMLSVTVPKGFSRELMLNWDQVREMHNNGIEFGGHTMNHPILSRVPIEKARQEIEGSKKRIEQELGTPVLGFAYPNGMAADINPDLVSVVKQAGYKAAFSLMRGPSPWREVRQNQFMIRRIFISHAHTLPHFAFLTSQINRYRQQ